MFAVKLTAAIVAMTLSWAGIALSATYTWEGDTDDDWDNTDNWDANGVPPGLDGPDGPVYGWSDGIVITNGANMPTVNVPDWHNNGSGTPTFTIEDGASLTMDMAAGGWGGPSRDGTVVTVGAGASLRWNTPSHGIMALMRHPNGLQTYDINGGTFTIEVNRFDIAFNENRPSEFNMDGGTFVFLGTQLWGSQGGWVDDAANVMTTPTAVNLNNGSEWDMSGATFRNRIWSGNTPAGAPTMVFDFRDTASSLTAKFGHQIPDLATAQSVGGSTFVSTTLGDENLVFTDNENGTFTVTVDAPAAPRPLAFESIDVNADNSITVTWISEDGATYALDLSGDMTPEEQTAASWAEHEDTIPSGGATTEYTVPAIDVLAAESDGSLFLRVRKR